MLTLLLKKFHLVESPNLGTRINTFVNGKFVGEDQFGNKYYENKKGKRWVIYKNEVEATNIPNNWYSWIHYTKNKIENEHNLKEFSWQKPHKPNQTGTNNAYHPNKSKKLETKKYKTWKN